MKKIILLLLFIPILTQAQTRYQVKTTYQFDSLNQVTEIEGKYLRTKYDYDELGNRIWHRLEFVIPQVSYDTNSVIISCTTNDTGYINIRALDTTYFYDTKVYNSNNVLVYNNDLYSWNNWRDSIPITDSGGYDLVVTVPQIDSQYYNQWFHFDIDDIDSFWISTQYLGNNNYNINMHGGTPPYAIFLSGNLLANTSSSPYPITITQNELLEVESSILCEGKPQEQLLFQTPTEVSTLDKEINKIKFYPNPTNGKVIIEFEDLKNEIGIDIIDINGKVLQRLRQKPLDNSIEVSLADYPTGSYLIKLYEPINESFKILKK